MCVYVCVRVCVCMCVYMCVYACMCVSVCTAHSCTESDIAAVALQLQVCHDLPLEPLLTPTSALHGSVMPALSSSSASAVKATAVDTGCNRVAARGLTSCNRVAPRGFCHLDATPRNVLLTSDYAYLMDYDTVCVVGQCQMGPVPPESSQNVLRRNPVRLADDEHLVEHCLLAHPRWRRAAEMYRERVSCSSVQPRILLHVL